MKKFNYWIIIEGAAANNGSTSWCNSMSDEYHNNGKSIDGTHEFLQELRLKEPNIKVIFPNGLWKSKDDQVNEVIPCLQNIFGCYLWQIDIDEFWNEDDLTLAEFQLTSNKAKGASFTCDYFVGNINNKERQLQVRGGWGEGNSTHYNRLWHYQMNDSFLVHEPAIIKGQTSGNTIYLPYRFQHFSYVDKSTVKFKNDWYAGHEGILDNWERINKLPDSAFPLPVSELLPTKKWDDGKTFIYSVQKASFVLYIQWFKSANEVRNAEIIKSIQKNASNPDIQKIYIFAEHEFTEVIPKVEVIQLGRRMTYLDCFQHIKLISRHKSYVIIANSDIIIPQATTEKLKFRDLLLKNTFIALSRYDYISGSIEYVGLKEAEYMQDVWIFKPEDISLDKFSRSNFYLGVCSCDNIIARIAHDAGMRVINPSLYLKTVHLHESRYRTYSSNSGYYGLIAFIKPTDNFSDDSKLDLSHSVWEKPIYI